MPMRGRGGMGRRRGRRRMRRRRRRRILLVGGLVAFGAYKFSKRDADRIQEDSGVAPEEMTDEELEQSMENLGIEKQYRDANDQEEAAPAAAAAGGGMGLDDLERLAHLRDEGILTEEEFTAKKRQILGL
jgi:hypothetical protein